MKLKLYAIVGALILGLATPTSALDLGPLKLNGSLKFWASDSPKHPARIENTINLKIPTLKLNLNDWIYRDLGGPKIEDKIQHKLTLGYEVVANTQLLLQHDSLTGRPDITRVGIEWRW
jgi:hypothetical protein